MTALRVLNVIVWGLLMLYVLPGAWSASFGNGARHGDPMRLSVFTTALIIVGFCVRGIVAPHNDAALAMLYVLCAADGLYIGRLAKAYGRGKLLG